MDDIVTEFHSKKKVAGIFLDLSSAFDMVDHEILMRKLYFYGIRGQSHHLLQSYLNNRYQFVELKSSSNNTEFFVRSEYGRVNRGVPQGSVLGPILFILYTNDLRNYICDTVTDCRLTVFADDTSAVVAGDSLSELSSLVSKALTAFQHWFYINSLQLNTDKTKIMLFKPNTKKTDELVVVNNNALLEIVDSVKFLGVRIDTRLNWKEELEVVEHSVSSACYALRSLRDELSIEQLRTVYFALVESRLRYSIKLWGYSYKYNVNRAFVVQKRAIRTIVRIPQWVSCRSYFTKLGLLTVPCLYVFVLLTDFIKNLSKYESLVEQKLRLQTRTKNITQNFFPKSKVLQHSAKFQTVHLFNKLPTELKVITSHSLFSKKLRIFLLKGCFYSVDEIFSNN